MKLSSRPLSFVAIVAAVALPALAATVEKPALPTFSPASSVVLRNTFDTDPSEYIGAFVTQPGIPDESASATKLKCSSYVDYKEVGAGDNETLDYFTSSAGGALKLGFPPVLASGKADSGVTTLVKYIHTRTFRATVADPEGFSQCCANYPGECREYYIGDFLFGTGTIYLGQEFDTKGKALIASPIGAVDAMAYGGHDWIASKEFKKEVAFGFKLKASPVASASGESFSDAICKTEWQDNVPNDTRGHWESAVSDIFPDLAGAKDNSWDHAAKQVAKWCGVEIETTSSSSRSDSTDGVKSKAVIVSDSDYQLFAAATVKRMRRVCGEKEEAPSPRGTQYRYQGLYLLPADQESATCAAVDALAETAKSKLPK